MRTAVSLVRRPEFAISAVTCRDDHASWSEAEIRDRYGVVLVRRGRFRRRVRGTAIEIDSTVGYASPPGEEEQFAHSRGGDECTWLTLTPQLWSGITDGTGTGQEHDGRARRTRPMQPQPPPLDRVEAPDRWPV